MAILPIIETPDARLKTISTPVDGVDDALRAFIKDMFETMYDAPGIGLAAIQVGVAKRVLVIDLQERDEESGAVIREPRVFINPEIVKVEVEKEGTIVVGTSIMGLMMLGAALGDVITIRAEGDGAEDAVTQLADLVEARFHEAE